MAGMDPALGWVDLALLAVLLMSVIVGLVRGLVYEVLALIGWVAAYFAAQWLAPMVGEHLPLGRPGSGLNYAAAFASVFLLALVIWGLAARLVRMLVHATPLSLLDRLLGAVFGVARGMILLLAVATVVGLTPLNSAPQWRDSRGRPWLEAALRELKPVLPPEVSRLLPV